MKYAFIVNPTAGNGNAVTVMERLQTILEGKKADFETFRTEYAGHGTELARGLAEKGAWDCIVSVGGDGTVREVAAGLVGSETTMGIIPAGTGNDLIKTAGIPKMPEEALDFLMSHEKQRIDTGWVNDSFFINVCGTGFDVTVLDEAAEKKKKYRGLTPYFLGLLAAIRHYEPVSLTIEYDGKTEKGDFLICTVANGRYIGGGIPICPAADIHDGLFDLVMIRNVPRRKIPMYLPGLMLKKDLQFRITKHERAKAIRIQGKNLRVNIDGEIRPANDIVFRVNLKGLYLICDPRGKQ